MGWCYTCGGGKPCEAPGRYKAWSDPALWRESRLLTSAVAGTGVESGFFFTRLIAGRGLTGLDATAYMFNPAQPLSLLIVWMLYRLGYDRRAATLVSWVVLPAPLQYCVMSCINTWPLIPSILSIWLLPCYVYIFRRGLNRLIRNGSRVLSAPQPHCFPGLSRPPAPEPEAPVRKKN